MADVAYGTNVGLDFTFLSDIDTTNDQFAFVVLGTDGYVDLAGAGVRCLGIIQDEVVGSTATPKATQVRIMGPSKVKCGGSFSPGDLLSSNASGLAVKYTKATVFTGTPYIVSGTQVMGIALSAGAINETVAMYLQPSGLSG
jgi:hypothetical protein